MQICYVHGAGASERSFNWLKEQLPDHVASFFVYPTNEPVTTAAKRLSKLISDTGPICLVGHSLGGIIVAACADAPNVEKLVTICAPFGGVKHAEIMSMFSIEPLFQDLRTHGSLLTGLRSKLIKKPHLAIVGTHGLPFLAESNDGVVSVASQMALEYTRYEMLPFNHFEVLLSPETVILITKFIRD
jgi:pimeloyl-ACP methyl ester carboxylesterase